MDQAISSPSQTTIEEKLAKLCVRPHLSSDILPRFVVILLESALHSMLCSFAACVMEIIRQYRAGTLEPWPDAEAEEAAQTERGSTYQRKSHPAAPRRGSGATPVRSAPAALREMGVGDAYRVVRPAFSLSGDAAVRGDRSCLRRVGSLLPWVERCRPDCCFSAAEMRRENCVQIVPVS